MKFELIENGIPKEDDSIETINNTDCKHYKRN